MMNGKMAISGQGISPPPQQQYLQQQPQKKYTLKKADNDITP